MDAKARTLAALTAKKPQHFCGLIPGSQNSDDTSAT